MVSAQSIGLFTSWYLFTSSHAGTVIASLREGELSRVKTARLCLLSRLLNNGYFSRSILCSYTYFVILLVYPTFSDILECYIDSC